MLSLLDYSRVHSNWMPMFSRGCLLPCIGRTDVQQSQIQFNGYEPRVVGSSRRSFPVKWRHANCSSDCKVMVWHYPYDMVKEYQELLYYRVWKAKVNLSVLVSAVSVVSMQKCTDHPLWKPVQELVDIVITLTKCAAEIFSIQSPRKKLSFNDRPHFNLWTKWIHLNRYMPHDTDTDQTRWTHYSTHAVKTQYRNSNILFDDDFEKCVDLKMN